MAKIYHNPPDNLSEIKQYAVSDNVDQIIGAKTIIFYDACSFRFHMNVGNLSPIVEFLKSLDGTVVLTITVLMELSSRTGKLEEKELAYLSYLKDNGIKIAVMFEEEFYDVLRLCFTDTEKVNGFLSEAVKICVPSGSLLKENIIREESLKKQLYQNPGSNTLLPKTFFDFARNGKTESDNLGEIMIVTCMMLLSNIPANDYRIFAISDDKGAIRLFGKMRNRLRDSSREMAVISTPALCWHIWIKKNEIDVKREDVLDILSKTTRGGQIKVLCSAMYEMNPVEKDFTAEELSEKICDSKGFRVYS